MKSGTTSKTDDLREREIEKKVRDYARALGFYCRKFVSPSHRGVPDHIFISPDSVVFMIEFKAPGKTPTLLQELEHQTIRRYKIAVYVVDSVEEGKAIVDRYASAL